MTTLERLLYVTTTSFKPSKTFTKSFLEGLNTPVENNCEITLLKSVRVNLPFAVVRKRSCRLVTRRGARGAFAPPPPTGPKGPHFDTQYPS